MVLPFLIMRGLLLWIGIKVAEAQVKQPPSYLHYPNLESYLVQESTIYRYEGYIYLPYALSCPVKQLDAIIEDEDLNYFFSNLENDKDCPARQIINNIINATMMYMEDVIPNTDVITSDYSSFSEDMIREGIKQEVLESTLNDRKQNIKSTGKNLNTTLYKLLEKVDESKPSYRSKRETESMPVLVRQKRVVVVSTLVVAAGVGLFTLIASGFAWNRYDLNKLQSRMEVMDLNLEKIANKLNEQTTAINTITINQNKIYASLVDTYKDLLKLNNRITCLEVTNKIIQEKINNWVFITTQSFIRSVNSALLGDLSIDLVSGTTLKKIIRSNMEIRDTIYIRDSRMFYRYGKIEIASIRSNPPILTGVIILPNVKSSVVGLMYRSYSCPFIISHTPVRAKLPMYSLRESDKGLWAQIRQEDCVRQVGSLICPPEAILGIMNPCIREIVEPTNDTELLKWCNVQVLSQNEIIDHIPVSVGLILCPNKKQVSVIWETANKVRRTKSIDISNQSIMLTSQDGKEVVIGGELYPIKESYTITVTSEIINVSQSSWENITIDHLPSPLIPVQHIDDLELLKFNTPNHNNTIIICASSLAAILIIIGIAVLIRMRQNWHKVHTLDKFIKERADLLSLSNTKTLSNQEIELDSIKDVVP